MKLIEEGKITPDSQIMKDLKEKQKKRKQSQQHVDITPTGDRSS